MADQLGSAVLTLSVDDRQLQAGFQAAQTKAASAGRTIEQAFTKTGKPLQTATNGLQYFVDAQGRARDASGKYLTLAARQAAGIGAVGQSAAGAAGGVGALGAGLGALAAPLATAAAVGITVAGIGYAATQTAGSIQKLNAAFTGLTGSAEAAKQLRQDLFTLSKTTPFRNEEILQAAQRFLAVGVSVNNLQGTINRVGAIAAQSGQPLERLALIYAQVYAKGRLQGEENLQLLEAGVDLTQELSQVTGKSGAALQDAMSKGQIGIKEFNAALLLATGDMSALQLAGQAVDVQFNNIFDNLGQLFGGFASSIAPALSAAFGVINQIFDQAFPSLASIEELFAPLTEEAKRFSDVLAGNPELISAIAAAVREWAGIIVNNVASGLQTVSNILEGLDAEGLVKSFLQSELVIRRIFLAATALGALLVKNAELTIRAASNPLQFGKDLLAAGGFGKFIQNEYKDVEKKWNDWANSKPLELPEIKGAGTGELAGGLDNKVTGDDSKIMQQWADRIAAANKLLDIEQQIKIASQSGGLNSAGKQALQAVAQLQSAVRREQEAQAQYRASGDQASLDASKEAAANTKLAAQETKQDLLDAYKAAQDSVRSISRSIKDATLQLLRAQGGNSGINRYLSGQALYNNQKAAFQQLLPQFLDARQQAAQTAANQGNFYAANQLANLNFTGSYAQVNQQMADFIDTQRSQERLMQDLTTSNYDLLKAQNSLAVVVKALTDTNLGETLPSLATSINNLVDKDWSIQISVAADGSTSYYGDVQNGALAQ